MALSRRCVWQDVFQKEITDKIEKLQWTAKINYSNYTATTVVEGGAVKNCTILGFLTFQ
jgi:hypothetical protein